MPLDVFLHDLYRQLSDNAATELVGKLFDLDPETSRLRVRPSVRWAYYHPKELRKDERRAGCVNGPPILGLWDSRDGDRAALYSMQGRCVKKLTLTVSAVELPEPDHLGFEASIAGLSRIDQKRRRRDYNASVTNARKHVIAAAYREPWQFLADAARDFSNRIAERATAREQRALAELRVARDPASRMAALEAQVAALQGRSTP